MFYMNGTKSKWYSNIIPTNSTIFEALENNQDFVSKTLLRKSRPFVGNVDRFHRVLQKIHRGECIVWGVLGGSVTVGHNMGGPRRGIFPNVIQNWLNYRYPCKKNGVRSVHERVEFRYAPGVLFGFENFEAIFDPHAVPVLDLVLVEWNVNDGNGPGAPGRPYYENASIRESVNDLRMVGLQWIHEIFIRKFLRLRKPEPVALIYLSADFIGRLWSYPPYVGDWEFLSNTFNGLPQWMIAPILSVYQIPVVSVVDFLLPQSRRRGKRFMFNDTNKHSISKWHADACCHPMTFGHLVIAFVFAFQLQQEMQYVDQEIPTEEQDLTALQTPYLPDGWKVTEEEDKLYVLDPNFGTWDFTQEKALLNSNQSVVANTGWTVYAENKEHDKFGLIATEAYSYFALNISINRKQMVIISYLSSYENIGAVALWVSNSTNNNNSICKTLNVTDAVIVKNYDISILNAVWEKTRGSVPNSFSKKLTKSATYVILHICLLPQALKFNGTNKFKIFGIYSR